MGFYYKGCILLEVSIKRGVYYMGCLILRKSTIWVSIRGGIFYGGCLLTGVSIIGVFYGAVGARRSGAERAASV